MAGLEAHGSWHSVSSIFAIMQSTEWPATDYHNSLVFVNETRNFFPGASVHEKNDVKTSASDVYAQHKIWMLPQPTN